VIDALMKRSDTNTAPRTSASVGSRKSSTAPSRARGFVADSGAGLRRACRSRAASATKAKVAASTISAIEVPPVAASRPPASGPAVIPT
jgi:hypothetical protein